MFYMGAGKKLLAPHPTLCYKQHVKDANGVKQMVDQERLARIQKMAENYYPDGEYRDMIYDILSTEPERDDSEIAKTLAMSWAYP